MTSFWMNLLNRVTRLFGPWFYRWVSWFVATGYFLFKSGRVQTSVDLYQALFPGHSRAYYLDWVWKQFHTFADSYADKAALDMGRRFSHVSIDFEHIASAARSGQGAIILTSHLGNWEIGARFVSQWGLTMTLYMGERERSVTGSEQKEDLRRDGFQVNVSSSNAASPFDSLDALNVLRKGGLISIAGDIAWTSRRQRIEVRFLNRRVWLPLAPHMLALASGAPIITVFAFRDGVRKHRFVAKPPRYVRAGSREERQAALQASAQQFADELEEALREHPDQWGVFEPFLGPPIEQEAEN
jgi:lauroyl/myristoyl acyltransferase